MFNLLGEQKILSLFIMGESGVGKTELARIISKNLDSDTKLAKINFGNYSSKDALNSLIGSPRGYIGSDGGELFNRVLDSDSGVILIDEFEKSDQAVFNYFLDVLESGKLVNSLGEEIDINGYIIVFTSNIDQEHFFRRISPELRSRFTYICKFDPLSKEEKEQFLETRLNKIFEKYAKVFKVQLVDNYKIEIQSKIDVNSYTNMRDLNNAIRLSFTEFITEIS